MENLKYSVWAIWFGSAAAILLGSGWVAGLGHVVFWSTLVAHLAEFFVKRSVMARSGGSMTHHFVQTMVYGLFHWKPLEDALAGTPED
jgi:hypothetical protein